ncbi:MAG: 3-deoxy-manno-octulosonate cytidylyltransferase [Gammaproteobacteria bacterium]|nr:MAG: 3-deoxy-manno-octulosonate cytidylyltransferase [Gammaproteobacteria bacterium]
MHIIIPARYTSTRLPGKPLLDIAGKTLIHRVYDCACAADPERIIIATDDARIEQAARDFGAEVCMTSADHESGTDRIAEVITSLSLADDTVVVNLQGDEPMVPGAMIRKVVDTLANHDDAVMATACHPVNNEDEYRDVDVVKVVVDNEGYALYFSRSPIPWGQHEAGRGLARHHIGLYAYYAGFVREFSQWSPCPMEQAERLEQLRVLWHGSKIAVCEVEEAPGYGVDTAVDLARVRQYFI